MTTESARHDGEAHVRQIYATHLVDARSLMLNLFLSPEA